jgi:biotin-(acetyl-CoA carboxylase) ligase
MTLAAGVALAEAVEEVTALSPAIKWPNDLLIGRRKVAGILAESVSSDLAQIVLGYGINVGMATLHSTIVAGNSRKSSMKKPEKSATRIESKPVRSSGSDKCRAFRIVVPFQSFRN